MSYDDIKHELLADCHNLTIEQLYQIFKQRFEDEQNDILLKQWGSK